MTHRKMEVDCHSNSCQPLGSARYADLLSLHSSQLQRSLPSLRPLTNALCANMSTTHRKMEGDCHSSSCLPLGSAQYADLQSQLSSRLQPSSASLRPHTNAPCANMSTMHRKMEG